MDLRYTFPRISCKLVYWYTNLQSLVKCLDHRGIALDTACSQARLICVYGPNVALDKLETGAPQKTVNKVLMTTVFWCRSTRHILTNKHWTARLHKNRLLAWPNSDSVFYWDWDSKTGISLQVESHMPLLAFSLSALVASLAFSDIFMPAAGNWRCES